MKSDMAGTSSALSLHAKEIYVKHYLLGEITVEKIGPLLDAAEEAAMRHLPLRVTISSIGGDVSSAVAIHDILRAVERSEAVGRGFVQSAALIAFLGAHRRLAGLSTLFLNHGIAGEWPFPDKVQLKALVALNECPEGYFDAEAALKAGVIDGLG